MHIVPEKIPESMKYEAEWANPFNSSRLALQHGAAAFSNSAETIIIAMDTT